MRTERNWQIRVLIAAFVGFTGALLSCAPTKEPTEPRGLTLPFPHWNSRGVFEYDTSNFNDETKIVFYSFLDSNLDAVGGNYVDPMYPHASIQYLPNPVKDTSVAVVTWFVVNCEMVPCPYSQPITDEFGITRDNDLSQSYVACYENDTIWHNRTMPYSEAKMFWFRLQRKAEELNKARFNETLGIRYGMSSTIYPVSCVRIKQ